MPCATITSGYLIRCSRAFSRCGRCDQQAERRATGRRPAGHRRHHPRHPQRVDVARRLGRLCSAQDFAPRSHPLEPRGPVRSDARAAGRRKHRNRDGDDRQAHLKAHRIASHRGEAALIEAVARTKGGPSSKLYIDFDVKPLILIKEEGHGE
jgi:hypothetical protein